jgi:hypothetical protein
MFARKVSVCLKPNALEMFTNLVECELLPWLRTQEGFLDLITLAGPDGIEVQAISFWDRHQSGEACNHGYPAAVLRALESLLDGITNSKTFEVVSSTVRMLPAPGSQKAASTAPRADQSSVDYGSYETSV